MQVPDSNGETSPSAEQPSATLLDPQKLDSIRSLDPGGKAGLLKKVIALFIEKSPALVQQMADGLDHGDSQQIYRAAHSLKSSSATIGALGLAETCRQLEMVGREGALAQAPELISKIRMEFSLVCTALTRQLESL